MQTKSRKAQKVRLGVVGVGSMGSSHCRSVLSGQIEGCELAAVCDTLPSAGKNFPEIPFFPDIQSLIASNSVDAVLIATPHYSHTPIGIAALQAGLHVLVEKPISVHKADCERLIAAHRGRKQVFAAMFNQRTDPYYQKVHELVRGGTLGTIRRVNWTITDWFRSEAYYASGGWRATWAGEGGGVLLNQCPHNLDLFQWIFGMPSKVRGFCSLGRYHDIEVEDDVTAYFEYPDGMTAVFVTSTGEAPGTNRLEIAGEQGKLVMEGRKLEFTRNEVGTTEFSRTTETRFSRPAVWNVTFPLSDHRGDQHKGIMQNFVNAILRGEKLLAPAAEGLHSVELGNAILLSSINERTVELPISSRAVEKMITALSAKSKHKKKEPVRKVAEEDFSKSFQ